MPKTRCQTWICTKTWICTIGVAIAVAAMLPASALAVYSLVWSDEFDGTSLNATNWNIDIGNGCPSLCGWGNSELEYYRAQNVAVSGGNLVLTAKAESYGGASFTSGKVHTKNKQTFLYGRVEMRAKLPVGGGMWPAFWMMPQADVYGGWAASGEIDIMESSNGMTEVGGTIHYGGSYPANTSSGGNYDLGGTSFADAFHTYAVEWEPDVIRWYVDGVLYSTKTSAQWYSDAAPGNARAPFDQEFYLILNAAVGGWYTGCTSPSCVSASLPQEYLIDYVRVYQDIANFAPTVTITSTTGGLYPPAGDITITADAADSDGSVARVEFYDGTTLLGSDTAAPYEYVWPSVGDGCYSLVVKAIDNLGAEATETLDLTVGAGCGQASYLGGPLALPAKIEAEDFDTGGEGIAYHDTYGGNNGGQYRPAEDVDIEACSDAGGGYNVGWISDGEWLEYTVNVPSAGDYVIETRVASQSTGGTFRLEFNGVDKTGALTAPVTGAWQNWQSVMTTVSLDAGTQVMRFVPIVTGFNINSFDVTASLSAVLPNLPAEGYALHPAYPNPFNPTTTISFDLPATARVNLAIYDVAGRMIRDLVAGETVAAGRHEVIWRGRDTSGRLVAAGVYYYRLDAGEFSATRRMTLVK